MSSPDLESIRKKLHDLNYWDRFRSDIILEVSTILTEPVCPVATIRFELPKRSGMNIIAQCHGNTIDEAIENAVSRAMQTLKE